jgi:hypothetical protein
MLQPFVGPNPNSTCSQIDTLQKASSPCDSHATLGPSVIHSNQLVGP